MENSEPRGEADHNPASVIGAGIVITGNVEAAVDLHVEGRINGDLRCGTLLLGENSVIAGNIRAERVRVSGTVEGSIETQDIAVESTARVAGDIVYSRLKVASGGIVHGNLQHRSAEEAADGAKLKLVERSEEPKKKQPIFIE